MSEVIKLVKESTMRDIAEAIKTKEGTEDRIPVAEMAQRISELSSNVEYTSGSATLGNNYNAQSIPHGLSKKPKLFFLYWNDYATASTIYLNYVLYTEKLSAVWHGAGVDGFGVNNGCSYSTIPNVDIPDYGAVSADETSVNITQTARKWTAGEYTWEAWTW